MLTTDRNVFSLLVYSSVNADLYYEVLWINCCQFENLTCNFSFVKVFVFWLNSLFNLISTYLNYISVIIKYTI